MKHGYTRFSSIFSRATAPRSKLGEISARFYTIGCCRNSRPALRARIPAPIWCRTARSTYVTSGIAAAPGGDLHCYQRTISGMEKDVSTLSSYDAVRVKSTKVDVEIDWTSKVLRGSVTYTLETRQDLVVLDTNYLEVTATSFNGVDTPFSVGAHQGFKGSALKIGPVPINQEGLLKVTYATTDKCTAAQWLEPEQTATKIAPYLFTQGEAIHNRSLFPSFDTPSIKSAFDIAIKSEWPVVATGVGTGKAGADKIYRFKQPVPIPSYLFAMASGNIVSRPIGPRSLVWTEPSNVNECQWEFEHDTEKFIQTAESLVFPYEWQSFNVLVLPPSFPFGGMENPNITFATPTLIAGDRSLVDVIAHELSHSWSGNLVTSATWASFWLNEGWTVYLERRILGAMHGEAYRHFEALIGWKELEQAIKTLEPKFTSLVIDMEGGAVDPDDSFSTVPYEKGSSFLWHLESVMGSKRWDEYIPWYFKKFRYQSLDTKMFVASLYEFFTLDGEKSRLDSVDWDTWLHKQGLPPKPKFDTSLVTPCLELADKWIAGVETGDLSWASKRDIEGWSSMQLVVLLDELADRLTAESKSPKNLPHITTAIEKLGAVYNLQGTKNCEVKARWFRIAVIARLEQEYAMLAAWIGVIGRMKFVRPGYRQLASVDRDLAVRTFEKHRDFYHPICMQLVKKDLGL